MKPYRSFRWTDGYAPGEEYRLYPDGTVHHYVDGHRSHWPHPFDRENLLHYANNPDDTLNEVTE